MNEYANFIVVYTPFSLEYQYINGVFFPFCHRLFLKCLNRNYNPVERRCKGGKGGAMLKGCQKAAKSLQTNNMHSPGCGDPVEPSKTFSQFAPVIHFLLVMSHILSYHLMPCQSRIEAGEELRNGRGKFFWRNSSFVQGGRQAAK